MALTGLLLVWFGVPFVLQQDLWPLLRMGMFAQVAKANLVTERFEVLVEGKAVDFSQYGLAPATAQHLIRKYWYAGKAEDFVTPIAKAIKSHDSLPEQVLVVKYINNAAVDSVVWQREDYHALEEAHDE